MRHFLTLSLTLTLATSAAAQTRAAPAALQIVDGVNQQGLATDGWLDLLRRRQAGRRADGRTGDNIDSVSRIRKEWTAQELAWRDLIRQRAERWEREIPALARLFDPVPAPARATIVLGNRGGEDAFTHDPVTIGFDLAALQLNYGDASQPANQERIDRFFRHEYTHLMQKAWLATHPWPDSTPFDAALLDIWLEGLGNYYSLSERWKTVNGAPSESAARARAELVPRLVERMSALACATREEGEVLMADLSMGRFDQKWGALPAALWLEEEQAASNDALRRFVLAGPGGVRAFLERHLGPEQRAQLDEAQRASAQCR
jgi:hypothetical protein